MKFDLEKPEDRWGKAKTDQPKRFDKDITIKLNLKKILKSFFVITLLFAVFFLGRLSVPGSFSSSSAGLVEVTGSTPSAAATVEEVPTEEEVQEEPAPVVEETPEEPVEEVLEEPKEESIITEYNNVVLSIKDVGVDWKGTWGKISSITYSLKNDEAGTIKAHHFTMMVEGYPVDEPGEFEAPYTSQKVKSLTSIQDTVVVYGFGGKIKGFSYVEKETGDLTDVEIKLFLWDASKNLIAHAKKTVDLSG